MDEYYENRFGYLRVLTYDEKINKIHELEEDINTLNGFIDNKNTSSEQKNELYSDIAYDREVIQYLKSILEEKQL